jgi:hypothetical protein
MSRVVLRQSSDELGSRYVEARTEPSGDVVIMGQDLGQGVEDVFGEGNREYEWAWTIRAVNVPRMVRALGGSTDALVALANRFSGENAEGLLSFVKEQRIEFDSWSRVGD